MLLKVLKDLKAGARLFRVYAIEICVLPWTLSWKGTQFLCEICLLNILNHPA